MNSKRVYERLDVSKYFISVDITNNGTAFALGRVKDLSKLGISFYTYGQAILPEMGKFIYVSFVYRDVSYQFEVELLREIKTDVGYLCAGKFVGVSALTKKRITHLLTLVREEELVLV